MTVHERMAQVTRAVSHIAKQTSKGVTYEFRSIDAVMQHLHGPLADAGLTPSPRVLDDWQVNMIPGTNNRTQAQALFRVALDFYAEDGSMVTIGPGLAQSHDYGDKAVYQAQQNAIKYLLLTAFSIPTAELDMDSRHPDEVPAVSPESVDRLDFLITTVEDLGLEIDAGKARTYAMQSQAHADKAVTELEDRIAAHHWESTD